MRTKLLEAASDRTFVLIFDTGDEVSKGILDFAKRHQITSARLTAIGAFSDVVLGYFDWQKKEYLRNPVSEQVEVLSMVGDIAVENGEPKLHAHVVVGKRDGSAWGGHLLQAHVRPTLEVMVVVTPAWLERKYDAESGLALIRV